MSQNTYSYFHHTLLLKGAKNGWLGETVRFFVALMCCGLWIVAAQPALASPQTDANEIVAHYVNDADFKTTLSKMWADAYASKLSAVLAARAVTVVDQKRFTALVMESTGEPPFKRLERNTSATLAQIWQPAELKALADSLRHPQLRSRDLTSGQTNVAPITTDSLDQALSVAMSKMQQQISALRQRETSRGEAALFSVAIALIGGMAQETHKIEIDLSAPYVAEMLEVDGVFRFTNRIARNDLIRELRRSDPAQRSGIVWRKPARAAP
ncbi:hypothetical protein [Cypionkella aquatica]|uniref:hypothetical protein n=1 Tax=Cypionkella aquatica TaxID=1756042 RepID=UPI0024E06164|nr:hypothetical protein [Cypionkella aquatica]